MQIVTSFPGAVANANAKPRARIYIDGANVFYTLRDLGWKMDYVKLKALICTEFEVVNFRFYAALKAGDDKMPTFLRFLTNIGITPRTKELKEINIRPGDPEYVVGGPNIKHKGNLDVEMAVDMALEAHDVPYVIVIGGDSDFACVIERLQALGVRVIVFSSRRHLSWELKMCCHQYRFFEDFENMLRKS